MGCRKLQLNDYLVLHSLERDVGFTLLPVPHSLGEGGSAKSAVGFTLIGNTSRAAAPAPSSSRKPGNAEPQLGAKINHTAATLFPKKESLANAVVDIIVANASHQPKTQEAPSRKVTYEYDAQGRLAKVIKPQVLNPDNNNELVHPQYSYAYDPYGRLSKITDPKGRSTHFSYDALGRQLTRTLPMGQSESKVYNTLGQLESKTDFKGVLTEFTYDGFGRLTQKTHSYQSATDTVTLTYDDMGRQSTLTDSRGTTTYTYDPQNSWLTKITTPEGEVNYEYDPVTSRKTRTYSANTVVSYYYDTLGRLASVTDKDGGETIYNYTKVGSRSAMTLPNGAKTSYTYDDLNRLTNLTNVNASDSLLSSYTYTLAPNGRRTAVVELTSRTAAPLPVQGGSSPDLTTRNTAYTYDNLNRLTKEVSICADKAELDYTSEYTYDLTGNRLKKCSSGFQPESINYTYNNNDQLTLESNNVKGDTLYSYDTNGSQIGKVNTTANESYLYTYNLQNRLSAATINRMEDTSLVAITSSYLYNQAGIRVRSNSSTTIDNGVATTKNRKYLLDSGMTGYSQVLEEIDATNNTLIKSYTLGDDVLSQTVGGTTSYLQYDGHGSTRLLTSATSAIASRFDYDAYGKNLFSANVTNPTATDMLYSGEQFDPNLQMQYLRARYYDQNNGTFNRLDPFNGNMGDPQSLHKYGYAHSNPVNNTDPSGKTISVIGAIGVISVIAIMMTFMTGCSADPNPNQTSGNNSLLLYGNDKVLEKNAKRVASRLSIPEGNVIEIDSYGKLIAILRQQKKSKGRIKRLFLHFHGRGAGYEFYLNDDADLGDLGNEKLGRTLAPYVTSDALIHVMSCFSSSTYDPESSGHNFKMILSGLKTDKEHKSSSFTIIGYNVRIQISEDGFVRPSVGQDLSNPAVHTKDYENTQKVIATEKDGELDFEIIGPPPGTSKACETWYNVDLNTFKWEYKY